MATKSWAPAPPRLADDLPSAELDALVDDLFVVTTTVRGDYTGQDAARAAFEECRLDGARFTGAGLPKVRLSDAVLAGVDFSGADLEEAELVRCALVDCRLSGAILLGARLRDVTFTGCRIDGANLRKLSAERVRMEDTDLHDADLGGANLSATCLFGCDLTRVDISHIALGGARLHGSRLEEVRGMAYLKDAVLDSEQVFAVARGVLAAQGVRVEDDREPPG